MFTDKAKQGTEAVLLLQVVELCEGVILGLGTQKVLPRL
jgi:hypothetical protein